MTMRCGYDSGKKEQETLDVPAWGGIVTGEIDNVLEPAWVPGPDNRVAAAAELE
jgi:hypothetical protein